MAERPSFIKSVMSGIVGFVDGVIAGGLIGAVGGAIVGAIYAVVTGDVANAGTIATESAALSGTLMGSVGGVAGAMTGVVKSREAGVPSAQDITNAVNIAFAQGVGVGHNIAQVQQIEETQALAKMRGEENKWRDKIAAERTAAQNQGQGKNA